MFCSKCGLQLKTGANFCNSCGERVKPPVLETISAPSPSPRTIVSFDEFYAKKSLERMNRFEPKSRPSSAKKRRFAPSSTTTLSEVSINVGYMELDNQGKLKKMQREKSTGEGITHSKEGDHPRKGGKKACRL